MPKLQAFQEHICDTTTQIMVPLPLLAASEKLVSGMTDWQSIKARLVVGGLLYLGMGKAYEKGRLYSRKLFGIPSKGRELAQGIHDTLYCGAAFFAVTPPIYLAVGSRDVEGIFWGTLVLTGIGVASGYVMSMFTDAFRDLMGYKKCERKWFPEALHRAPSVVKTGLVAASVAAFLGLTSLVYHAVDDPPPQQVTQSQPLYASNNQE